MTLLSIKEAKMFTNAMAKDINNNIKMHSIRNSNEKVLFTEKKWTMTYNDNNELGAPTFDGARMWHLCDVDRERYQSPYDTIRGKCWSCEDKVPKTIKTLWTLFNADNMCMWLDSDAINSGSGAFFG